MVASHKLGGIKSSSATIKQLPPYCYTTVSGDSSNSTKKTAQSLGKSFICNTTNLAPLTLPSTPSIEDSIDLHPPYPQTPTPPQHPAPWQRPARGRHGQTSVLAHLARDGDTPITPPPSTPNPNLAVPKPKSGAGPREEMPGRTSAVAMSRRACGRPPAPANPRRTPQPQPPA